MATSHPLPLTLPTAPPVIPPRSRTRPPPTPSTSSAPQLQSQSQSQAPSLAPSPRPSNFTPCQHQTHFDTPPDTPELVSPTPRQTPHPITNVKPAIESDTEAESTLIRGSRGGSVDSLDTDSSLSTAHSHTHGDAAMRMSALPLSAGIKPSTAMGKESGDRVKIRGLDTSAAGSRGRNRHSLQGMSSSGLNNSSSEEDLTDQLQIHLSGGVGSGSTPSSRNSTIKGAAQSRTATGVGRKRSLAKSKSHSRLSISTANQLAGGERPQISPRKASLVLQQQHTEGLGMSSIATGSGSGEEEKIPRRRAATTDPRETLAPVDTSRNRSRSSTTHNSPLSSSHPSPRLLASRSLSTHSQAPSISPRSQAPGGSRASPASDVAVSVAGREEEGDKRSAGYFDVPVELPSRNSGSGTGLRSVSSPAATPSVAPGRTSMDSRGSVELEIERYLPGYGRSVSQASVRSGKSTPGGNDGEAAGHHGHHGFLGMFRRPQHPSSSVASGSTSPNLVSAQTTPSPGATPLATASGSTAGGYMNARLAREEERRLELERRRERERGRLVEVTKEDKAESAGAGKVVVKDGYKIIDGVEKKQSSSGVYTPASFPGVSGATKPKSSAVYTPPSLSEYPSPALPSPAVSSSTSPYFSHSADLSGQVSPALSAGTVDSTGTKRRSRFGSIGSIKGWKRVSGESAAPMPEDAMQKVEEERIKSISSPILSDTPIPQSARSLTGQAMEGVGLGFPIQAGHNRSVSAVEQGKAPQHPGMGDRASSYSQVQGKSRAPSGPASIYTGYQPEAITPIAESVPPPQIQVPSPKAASQAESPGRTRNVKNLSLPLSSLHETVVQQEIATAARIEADRLAAVQEEALRKEREREAALLTPAVPASLGQAARGTRRKPVPQLMDA